MGSFTQKMRVIIAGSDEEFDKMIGGSLGQVELLSMAISELTQPIDEFIEESKFMAQEFETSMASVSTLLGSGQDAMEMFGDELIAMSIESGKSASELAGALYQVVSAGIATGEAIQFLDVAQKGAIAGMSDTFTAVDAISTVLNSYNMSADKATHVSDLLFQTVKMGKTTFSELSGYVGFFASTTAAMGIALEQPMAAMATMTKQGLNTARAATSLSAVLRELDKPSAKVTSLLKKMGFESSQAAIKALGLQGVLAEMGKTAEASGIKFTTLWGDEAKRGAVMLSQNAKMAKDDLDSMKDAAGATEEAYATMMGTSQIAQERYTAAMDAFRIQVGKDFLPLMTKVKTTQAGFLEILNKMPKELRMTAGGLALVSQKGIGAIRMLVDIRRALIATRMVMAMIKKMKVASLITGISGKLKQVPGLLAKVNVSLGTLMITAAVATAAYMALDAIFDSIEKKQKAFTAASAETASIAITEKKLELLRKAYSKAGKERKEALKSLFYMGDDLRKADDKEILQRMKAYGSLLKRLKEIAKEKIKDALTAEQTLTDNQKKYRNLRWEALKYGMENIKIINKDTNKEIFNDAKKMAAATLALEAKVIAKRKERAAQVAGILDGISKSERERELEGYKEREEWQMYWLGRRLDIFIEYGKLIDEAIEANNKDLAEARRAQQQNALVILNEEKKQWSESLDKKVEDTDDALTAMDIMQREFVTSYLQSMGMFAYDAKEAWHNLFKGILISLLDYVTAKYILGTATSFLDAIFNPAKAAVHDVPMLIAAAGAITMAKGAIASFDDSGISLQREIAEVSPNEAHIRLDDPRAIEMLSVALESALRRSGYGNVSLEPHFTNDIKLKIGTREFDTMLEESNQRIEGQYSHG